MTRTILLCLLTVVVLGRNCFAQQPQQQPLNADVSDFGTSFIFSPPPVCPHCLETELGFLGVGGTRQAAAVITAAPFKSATDVSLLTNVLDSESSDGDRVTQFGNELDFVIRQQALAKGGFVLTAAPRGTVYLRDTTGGRIGGTAAAQYGRGKNLGVVNATFTRALANPSSASRNDYQGSFDFYRSVGREGMAWFAGFQHEYATQSDNTLSVEQGLVVPFRNGQMEFAVEELTLSSGPAFQYQTRVIVNWGSVFKKKRQ